MAYLLTLLLTLMPVAAPAEELLEDRAFVISGTMFYSDIEGGCWYLETSNGEKYQLTGSEADLERTRVAGRMLRMKVIRVNDMASVCMIGPLLRIIEIYDTVGYPTDQGYVFQQLNSKVYRTKSGCYYVKYKQQRYELDKQLVTSSQKKKGARLKGRYKVLLGKGVTNCNLDGLVVAAVENTRMKEIRKDHR